MADSMTRLPMELMLDLFDILLASRDKASLRAASRLAQTCAKLRDSDGGRRARYAALLASRSITIPEKLSHISDYEIETLGTSRWPHQEPNRPQEGTAGQIDGLTSNIHSASATAPLASDAYLVGGEQIILTPGSSSSLHRSVLSEHNLDSLDDLDEGALRIMQAVKRRLRWRGESTPDLESGALQQSLTTSREGLDRERIIRVAMDAGSGLYAVLSLDLEEFSAWEEREERRESGKAEGDDLNSEELGGEENFGAGSRKDRPALETVEIRRLDDGELALPGEQARLRFEASHRDLAYGLICNLQLVGDFILLQRTSCYADVHRWRNTENPLLHFARVWALSADEQEGFISATLIAPFFIAVQTTADSDTFEDYDDPAVTFLRMYRLKDWGSDHVATFDMPEHGTDAWPINLVASGAHLRPGEDGLFVIASRAHVWLLRVATMVHVLYEDAPRREALREYLVEDEEDSDADSEAEAEKEVQYSTAWTSVKLLFAFRTAAEKAFLHAFRRSNMLRITNEYRDTHSHMRVSVSGWRCGESLCQPPSIIASMLTRHCVSVFLYRDRNEPSSRELEPKLRFVDASATSCYNCEATELPVYGCIRWRAGLWGTADRFRESPIS